MKAKKMGLIGIILVGTVAFSAISASAAWYTCSIDNVGSTSSVICVRLSDTAATPAFTRTWFYLAGTRDKEMLATALTGMSMGKNLLINATGTTAFSDIVGIYVAE